MLKKKITYSRALAFDPKILILDEATSSINTETEELIQQAMEVLKEGRTTFLLPTGYQRFNMLIKFWFYQMVKLLNKERIKRY